jgi:hypothetical protein
MQLCPLRRIDTPEFDPERSEVNLTNSIAYPSGSHGLVRARSISAEGGNKTFLASARKCCFGLDDHPESRPQG